jgi:hypothetical protein
MEIRRFFDFFGKEFEEIIKERSVEWILPFKGHERELILCQMEKVPKQWNDEKHNDLELIVKSVGLVRKKIVFHAGNDFFVVVSPISSFVIFPRKGGSGVHYIKQNDGELWSCPVH